MGEKSVKYKDMKHLIPFRVYEAQMTSGLTQKQKTLLTKYTQGTWSVNQQTGLVDVEGSFNCDNIRLKSLRGISFGHVSGNFNCDGNQLTSLAGAPQTVGGDFRCSANQLTSLAGAPQTVGGDFRCSANQLTSLAGAPQTVDGNFSCDANQLTSLAGAPQTVGEGFYCSINQLTSLTGAPQTVGGDFRCSANQLTSLAGAPQTVDGNFDCDANQLTSLAGAPQTVRGDFSCFGNLLTSLAGAPQTVDWYFMCEEFKLDRGEWNMEGWLEVLNTGTAAAKKLILTLPWLQPDWWNSELQRDPGKTVHLLSVVWKHMPKDMQSAIKIPRGYEDDFELFSGFDELGLF